MTPDKFPFKLFSHWNSKTISIDSLFQSLANELLASWSKSASSLSHPALFFDLFSKFLREILHIRSRRFPRQKGAVLFFTAKWHLLKMLDFREVQKFKTHVIHVAIFTRIFPWLHKILIPYWKIQDQNRRIIDSFLVF